MDKLYAFKTKFITGHLSVDEQPAHSEGDRENSPRLQVKTRASKFSKLDFQTDESDDTPKLKAASSPKGQNKLSKFKQLSPDLEKDSDVRYSEDSDPEPQNSEQVQSQVEDQAKKLEEKYKVAKKPFQPPQIQKSNSSKQVNRHEASIRSHPFIHLIHGRSVEPQVFYKFIQLLQSGLLYSKFSLKGPTERFLKTKQLRLKERTPVIQKCLILDLDETLVHSCTTRDNPQVRLRVEGAGGGDDSWIFFNVRPYCREFLKEMSKSFTIYIFTASSDLYAKSIIDYLDPYGHYVTDILTRENCFETKNGFLIKDLRIILGKQLKDMIIVDNLPHSFGLQVENGIPILEFYADQNDEELKYLARYLIEASKQDDVRVYNKQKLRIENLLDHDLKQQL